MRILATGDDKTFGHELFHALGTFPAHPDDYLALPTNNYRNWFYGSLDIFGWSYIYTQEEWGWVNLLSKGGTGRIFPTFS